MNNITVYYQNKSNHLACTMFHPKYTNDFSKTHTKVYEGVIKNNETLENVFSVFNHDDSNPLSITNDSNKVCIINNQLGTGFDFQYAMKNKAIDVGHTSMSVGDIVSLNGVNYLCADVGWKKLTKDKPVEGKTYALTGGPKDKCIANGNTWKESEVT